MTRSLEERLAQDPAPGWKPEPGDSVFGTIVQISEAPGTNWGPYPLLEIEQDDGTPIAVHAFHTVLKRELESLAPSEGDRIGIRFIGKVKGGTQEYESYRVVLDRAAPRLSADTAPASAGSVPSPAAASASTWGDEEPF